ncbi:membrane dipeptidase [Neorhizobium galegae]|uniref:dipeptidase n=1 Tax=Neorhizobium galegae TaxID=399 RepID=UPI001AE93CFB|nr:dipeptidase [Neorhizobium galegae]MBP2548405.1 membrane dipeptidase [Neorhizobium galegae]
MMPFSPVPVFDGHNDVLSRMYRPGQADAVGGFLEGEAGGHIDLPRARAGGLAGGLCAVYVSSPTMRPDANGDFVAPAQPQALNDTMAMARLLFDLEARSNGAVSVCRSAADIRSSMDKGAFAAVLHIEGLEAVGDNLDALYVLHQAGLRSLGPVWSRPNIFAHGVPFRFPSSPDIGPGLTEVGKDLIRACNALNILIDLSHMNEKGFWDIAALSQAPLVASHSNAHALCSHSRNLTDRQLDSIRDTGGLVGINFGVLFLRDDGVKNPQTPVERIVDHVAYIADRIGIDHVGLGSDFDGTTVPEELVDASGLPRLIAALESRGFDRDAIERIAHRNWLSVLERTLGH